MIFYGYIYIVLLNVFIVFLQFSLLPTIARYNAIKIKLEVVFFLRRVQRTWSTLQNSLQMHFYLKCHTLFWKANKYFIHNFIHYYFALVLF